MKGLNKNVNFIKNECLKGKGDLFINLDKSYFDRAAYEKSVIFLEDLCRKYDYLSDYIENLKYEFMQLLVGLNIYSFKNDQLKANINFYDSCAFAEIKGFICDELLKIRDWGQFEEKQILHNCAIIAYGELYYNLTSNLHVNSLVADDNYDFNYNDYKNRFDFLKEIVCQTEYIQEVNSENIKKYIDYYDDCNFDEKYFDSLWSDYDEDFKIYRDKKVN